jgi:Tol biopolymer transport system component
MTTLDRFEQHLPEDLAELAAAGIPDYFDDLLQEAARTRQRPAWSSLERWLPMGVTALSPVSNRARSMAGFVLLILVGLLVAAGVAAYAGSHLQRIPAPFGPAGNGLMFYASADGDIFSVDPAKGGSRAIVAGPTADSIPIPSRNGQRLAFVRTVTGGIQVMIAGQDGSNVVSLPQTLAGFSEIDWSADDSHLAVISVVDGKQALSIVAADGSGSTTLDLGVEPHDLWYLADGRIVFEGTSVGGSEPSYALYVVNEDGTGLKPITAPTTDQGAWIGVRPSPDGRSLVYHRWHLPDEPGRLHVLDIATGNDRSITIDDTGDENHEGAHFSPDGSHILFTRFTTDATRLAIVPVAGGSAISLGPNALDVDAPIAEYSPDGKTVVAYYPSTKELWLLDATGGQAGGDRLLSLPVSEPPGWQRVAP